ILTVAVETVTFENLVPHVNNLLGVRIPQPDYAIGIKIKCFYMRDPDGHGKMKRGRDISDIEFICTAMAKRDEQVTDECARSLQCGYYHMFELREELEEPEAEALDTFLKIGGRKFLLPWDQNSPDQRDYYLCFAEAGTDPFTVPLGEE